MVQFKFNFKMKTFVIITPFNLGFILKFYPHRILDSRNQINKQFVSSKLQVLIFSRDSYLLLFQ